MGVGVGVAVDVGVGVAVEVGVGVGVAVEPESVMLRSSVISVPLLNRFRPKLSAVASAGIAGVCQLAWVQAVDAANQGLDVQ